MDVEDIEDTVAGLVGDDIDPAPATVVPIITTLAKAYTRSRGFNGNTPNDEIAAVITTASARLASHPEQVALTVGSVAFPRGGFTGWTAAELAVLNRYRVRAQ